MRPRRVKNVHRPARLQRVGAEHHHPLAGKRPIELVLRRTQVFRGRRSATTRYYLHVSNGIDTIGDEDGIVLAGPGEAMPQARVIAAEPAPDAEYRMGYVLYVLDESGNLVCSVPIVPELWGGVRRVGCSPAGRSAPPHLGSSILR